MARIVVAASSNMRPLSALRAFSFSLFFAVIAATLGARVPWLTPALAFFGALALGGAAALLFLEPALAEREARFDRAASWARSALLVSTLLLLGEPIRELAAAPTLRDALGPARIADSLAIAAALVATTLLVARAWRRGVVDADWRRVGVCAIAFAAPLPLGQSWIFYALAVAAQVVAFGALLRTTSNWKLGLLAGAASSIGSIGVISFLWGPTLGAPLALAPAAAVAAFLVLPTLVAR